MIRSNCSLQELFLPYDHALLDRPSRTSIREIFLHNPTARKDHNRDPKRTRPGGRKRGKRTRALDPLGHSGDTGDKVFHRREASSLCCSTHVNAEISTAKQMIADRAGRIREPDSVVEILALSRGGMVHAMSAIGDREDVSEEGPEPEARHCDADWGPYVRHGHSWDGNGWA